MPGYAFATKEDIDRVARATRRVEHMLRNRDQRLHQPQHPRAGPMLLKMTADCARNAVAVANVVTLVGTTETETSYAFTVMNKLRPKVWNDALVVCSPLAGELLIVQAWSALHLRALVNEAGGVAGGAFNVDTITALDGYFGPTTLTGVANPFTMDGDDNAVVDLEWNDAAGQWQAYQMLCPAP